MRTLVLFALALGTTGLLADDASAIGRRKKKAAAVVAAPSACCGASVGAGYPGGYSGVGYGQPGYAPTYGVAAPGVTGGFPGQPPYAGPAVIQGVPVAMPGR